MFCHKCGSKSLEGAVFCQKCGAKLIRGEAMEQSPVESALNTVPQAVEHTSEMPATSVPTAIPESTETTAVMAEVGKDRNEVTIHGYNKIENFDRKIKVFRNGELVGKVGQGETIVVPNNTDGTFLFKCSPMKAQYTVKAGSGELQLEWDLSRLKVFDLSSGNPLEKLEQIRKNNKKWEMAIKKWKLAGLISSLIAMSIIVIAMLIGFFMSDGANHVELVRYFSPFEDAGITATCEMVIDKYFTSPKWKERKGSDSIWYVDVNGKMAMDGEAIKNVTLTFKVTPEGNKYLAHTFMIEAYGIDIDGQSGNAEQASSFITALFDAYSQNYESMESYTTTAANSSGESGTENSSEGSQSMPWKVAYANKVRELAAKDNELQFALIDLTGSDIPALVSDHSSYYGSVFIWADGALFTVMEGIRGSSYLPGGNVICVWDKLQAGAIVYESYMTVNDAYEVVDIYDESLSSWYFKDINGDGIMDENEPVSEEPYYYYGNTEITAEEYSSYQIPGDYEWIAGDKSVEEIISQLNGENVTDSISVSEVLYKGIPVIPLLETSIDDIIALLGKPTDEGQYLQGYFYDYNNEILFILDADKRDISWIEISPEALTAGGVSLDKDRAFLVKTFGEPTKEYIDEMTREYTISYNIKKCTLAFILTDSSSKVSKVTIHFNGQ